MDKIKTFKRCPCCGSHDIARFEVDHFCLSCDWDTLLSDVQSGAFERRVGLQKRNEKLALTAPKEGAVLFMEDLNEGSSPEANEEENVA